MGNHFGIKVKSDRQYRNLKRAVFVLKVLLMAPKSTKAVVKWANSSKLENYTSWCASELNVPIQTLRKDFKLIYPELSAYSKKAFIWSVYNAEVANVWINEVSDALAYFERHSSRISRKSGSNIEQLV